MACQNLSSAGAAVVVAILTLDEFVISLTSERDLSPTPLPRSIRIMLPNSRPRHAARRPRRGANRRDLTPALVSWMLASAYLEEILYDETNTERHIFYRAALVGQRLHRLLQAGGSRWVAETHQDSGHPAVPESQSAIQSRAALHLRCCRRGGPARAFAQRRFHARGRGCCDDRND